MTQEIANLRASVQQISLQNQNADIGNLFVSFMSTVDVTVVVTVLANFTYKLLNVHFYTHAVHKF